jgi:hypothetical protein
VDAAPGPRALDSYVKTAEAGWLHLYGTKLSPLSMAKETRFTCITLGGDPRKLGQGRVDAKLFYEAEGEGDYAEMFTNIDLGAKRVEIREKDPDYRSPIVRALRAARGR